MMHIGVINSRLMTQEGAAEKKNRPIDYAQMPRLERLPFFTADYADTTDGYTDLIGY